MVSDLIETLQKLSQPEMRNDGSSERKNSPANMPKQGLQGLRGYKHDNTIETLNISSPSIVTPAASPGLQGLQNETSAPRTEHFVTPVTPVRNLGLQNDFKNVKENQRLIESVTPNPCNPTKTTLAGGIFLSSQKLQPDTSFAPSPVPRPPSIDVPHRDTTHATVVKVPPPWVPPSARAVEALAREIAGLNLGSDTDREAALRARFGPAADREEAREDLAKVLDRARAVGLPEGAKTETAPQVQPTVVPTAPTAAPPAKRAQAELLAEMRPPDLQGLVAQYGGYSNVTPEAWAAYDQATARHRARMVRGDFALTHYKGLRAATAAPPDPAEAQALAKLDTAGLADAAAARGYFLILNAAGDDFRVTVGGYHNPPLDHALRARHGEIAKFLHEREQGLHSLRHKCGKVYAAWRDAFGLGRVVDINELATGDIPQALDSALLALARHDADRTALDADKLKRALRAMAEITADRLQLKFEGVAKTGADRWSLQTHEPADVAAIADAAATSGDAQNAGTPEHSSRRASQPPTKDQGS